LTGQGCGGATLGGLDLARSLAPLYLLPIADAIVLISEKSRTDLENGLKKSTVELFQFRKMFLST
jgi:hypothetical protein